MGQISIRDGRYLKKNWVSQTKDGQIYGLQWWIIKGRGKIGRRTTSIMEISKSSNPGETKSSWEKVERNLLLTKETSVEKKLCP